MLVLMRSLSQNYLLLALAVGFVLSLTPFKYYCYFGYLSGEEPFLTLRNIPVQTCVTECQLRNACMAVNYWRQRRDCEMLLTDKESLLQQNSSTQFSIFIKNSDVQTLPSLDMTTCLNCNNYTACDVSSSSCVIKECRMIHIDNGVVYGNILRVGARVKIVCDDNYMMSPVQSQSVCQSNGSWDNVPTCIPNPVCGDVPTVPNAVVKAFVTTAGSKSLKYACEQGYAARNTTSAVVQCINSEWETPNLTCLRACPEPTGVDNATLSNGDNLEGTVRYYRCIPEHVSINASSMSIVCQPNGNWTIADFQCVPSNQETGCPPDDLSFHHAFLQDGTVIKFRAFLGESTTFNGARAICEAAGGGLYQILTLAKMTFTLQLMACPAYQSNDFWIDGVYNQSTSVWETTAGTPLPMSQEFWYPGMPSSTGVGSCVWIKAQYGYKWDDKDCGVTAYAFCEIFSK